MKLKCSVYRGGTSRGLMFNEADLPKDKQLWANIFKGAIDCVNQNAVDGLGGSISSTNKVCVIKQTNNKNYDIEWEFYQVGVMKDSVDNKGTCGNLIAAVAAYAINEKLFSFDSLASEVLVRIFNTNIKKIIEVRTKLKNGEFAEIGDEIMQGVSGTCSLANVFIKDAGGEQTGEKYPLGKISDFNGIRATLLDLINPFLYVNGLDFKLDFSKNYDEFSKDTSLEKLNNLRDFYTIKLGFAEDESKLSENQAIPKIAAIFKSDNKEEFDIGIRVLSLRNLHKSSPASGLYNLAVAALENGTLANELSGLKMIENGIQDVRIKHFLGVVSVSVEIKNSKIIGVGLKRSARRIMDGFIYIKEI